MTLVEFAERTSPIPLSVWQKCFLTLYEQTKRENKRLLFVPTRISGRRILMQIIQEFEKEQAQ